MKYAIVEKKNHLTMHALCCTRESAERFLREDIPDYVKKSFFTDKTLKADSFEVIEYHFKKKVR